MQPERAYKVYENKVWLNDKLVELDSAVLTVIMSRDQRAKRGGEYAERQRSERRYIAATATGRSGTSYYMDPQGVLTRVSPVGMAYPVAPGSISNVAIHIEGPRLRVGGKVVDLRGPFCQILLLQDIIIMIIEPVSSPDTNNVFGVDIAAKVLWRIETPDYTKKRGNVAPYADVSISDDGRLIVADTKGRTFALDPQSGRIVSGMLGISM
jgi:outer membrane protein assembly factor BamB